jgi:hypothetical protein
MTIVQVLVGMVATAGLFAWFGVGFGLRADSRAAGCASCTGECSELGCPILEDEGAS